MTMKGRAIAALILIAALTAGCAGNQPTIIYDPVEYPEQQYVPEDYYAPGVPSEYPADAIAPAPADPTDWSGEQAGQWDGQGDQGTQTAPELTQMTRGDLTYGVVVTMDATVNPFWTTYRDFYAVNQLVFESLVDLDENLKPVPLLADTWSVDGSVWTFTLRDGIQFHNGQMLTAADVVASYQEIMNYPSTVWYELLSNVEAMEAVDSLTLRVKGRNNIGYMMLYAMTFPVAQRNTVSLDQPSGTGPYWYIRYDIGTSLRIERNPLWWKRASGYIESVVVLCYKSVQAALIGLELGQIDALATDYPTAAISRSLTDRMTIDYSTQSYECIVPNLRGTLLGDLNIRQALMYAIDRESLGATAYAGMVQESEVPVVPGSWLYDPQATRFNYSPERALLLLNKDGWEDLDHDGVLEKAIGGKMERLSLHLITYDRGTTGTRSEAVEAIRRQLALIGVEITVETGTASQVQSAMDSGKFDLALCSYEMSAVPNLAFMLASSARNSANYARYNSAEMDSYLHDAYQAKTEDELKAAMSKVQILLVEDLPILGLFFRAGVLITTQSVGGLSGVRQYDVLRGLATITPTK